jgi:hypothetical protein
MSYFCLIFQRMAATRSKSKKQLQNHKCMIQQLHTAHSIIIVLFYAPLQHLQQMVKIRHMCAAQRCTEQTTHWIACLQNNTGNVSSLAVIWNKQDWKNATIGTVKVFRGTSISGLQTIADTSNWRGVLTIIMSVHSNQTCQFSQKYNTKKTPSITTKNVFYIYEKLLLTTRFSQNGLLSIKT